MGQAISERKECQMTNFSANFQNSDHFRFLKFPHSLLSDKRYAGITNDAKLLYALMLDRTSLSVKHSWYDREGRLFIYYTVKEIEGTLQCSHNKVLRMLDELENVRLIQRAKQGQGKPTKFYIKKIL